MIILILKNIARLVLYYENPKKSHQAPLFIEFYRIATNDIISWIIFIVKGPRDPVFSK